MKIPKKPTVAIYGSSPLSLILGRACALREISLLAVYEPDPLAALRASLYLGVSARSTEEEILSSGADVVLASMAPPTALLKNPCRVLLLSKPENEVGREQLTWLESVRGLDADQQPTTIASRPPKLEFQLAGLAKDELADFLNKLSDSFTATSVG